MTLFLLVVVGIGIIWLYPGPQQPLTAETPASSREAGAEFDPVEWVRSEQEAPGLEEVSPEDGDEENFVVVYGESDEASGPIKPEVREEAAEDGSQETKTRAEPSAEKPRVSPPPVEAPPAREQEAPAPVTRSVTVKEYWIQAGSYTSRTRADRIKDELDELGLSGRILSKDVDGTQYYRVRIGPYSQKAEADKFLTWVKEKDNFENSYISEVYRKKTIVQ
ncbi:MAG: SPOR domain-containing protein [Sediminispirochaetaceae bacterium]